MDLVARGVDSFIQAMKALTPPGRAMAAFVGSNLEKIYHACADEFARIEAYIVNAIYEFIPSSTSELLPEWEQVAGLPEDFTTAYGISQTESERRDVLTTKLSNQGNLSIAYLESVLDSYGITATFSQPYTPGFYAGGPCNLPCGALANAFYIGVTIGVTALDHGYIESILERIKPADAIILYTYL